MYTRNDIITEERIAHLEKVRNEERTARFAALAPQLGEEAAEALRELYEDLFTTDMLIWYAGLWEPEIGGFYFSNSGRDTEGLLPDVESTCQALRFIETHCSKMPAHLRRKMAEFAWNLQDEDGYFYHPQWGKNIGVSRRGRDLGWGRELVTGGGMTLRYPLPTERKGEAEQSLPEYLRSLDAFEEYLESLPLSTRSYWVGNTINAQSSQIAGAGPEYAAAARRWIEKYQREDNGLWEPQINYASVNGLMKIAITYPTLGGVLPHAEKALESALQAAMSDEKITFCCQFFNPWAAVSGLLSGMEKMGETEKAAALRHLPEADSGNTCPRSQGALVAIGVREGDINGNGCSIAGPLRGMYSSLGVPLVPLFTEEDGKFLYELMDARVSVPKTLELPEDKKGEIIMRK